MTMRALIAAGRAICYVAAAAIDHAHVHPDSTERARASERASLLTPVVKAFATDIGVEATSLALQVHGGLGYIEATGVAQHFRDARSAAIYEGTNGIQAIDLVKRKVRRLGGATAQAEIAGLRREVLMLATIDRPAFGCTVARLSEAIEALAAATEWMLAPATTERAALAVATPYLRLFGLASAGAFLAKGICSALRSNQNCADAIATTRFYAEHIATAAPGLSHTVLEGAEAVESTT